MSVVEKIHQLSINTIIVDESFDKLKNALQEYHKLVEEGILIPRENNISTVYTMYSFNSNLDKY